MSSSTTDPSLPSTPTSPTFAPITPPSSTSQPSSQPSPSPNFRPFALRAPSSASTATLHGPISRPLSIQTRYLLLTQKPDGTSQQVPLISAEQLGLLGQGTAVHIALPKDQQIDQVAQLGSEQVVRLKICAETEFVPWKGSGRGGDIEKVKRMSESWWRPEAATSSGANAEAGPSNALITVSTLTNNQLPTPQASPTTAIPSGPRAHPLTQDFPARKAYLSSLGLFRIESCNAFKLKGSCKWADKCTYSHDVNEREAYLAKFGLGGATEEEERGVREQGRRREELDRRFGEGMVPHRIVPEGPETVAVWGGGWRSPARYVYAQNTQKPDLDALEREKAGMMRYTASEEDLVARFEESQRQAESQQASSSTSPTVSHSSNATSTTSLTNPPPRQPASNARQPSKGQKTHCTYFLRYGECDFMQQGCKFSHSAPAEPITAKVGNKAVVVVPSRDMPKKNPPVTARGGRAGFGGQGKWRKGGEKGDCLISFD